MRTFCVIAFRNKKRKIGICLYENNSREDNTAAAGRYYDVRTLGARGKGRLSRLYPGLTHQKGDKGRNAGPEGPLHLSKSSPHLRSSEPCCSRLYRYPQT
ncbi:hypothetical protein EVAR_12699_1 [Eumeta japonica]|uniref:Uncharacterized protein n=1 Tax=Eumeta variegata TaxID=151549 RepID=A0A4C1UML2_EUMVA|nr:hypothetical protein EVAR_12699_1 [Eumeta japonica]